MEEKNSRKIENGLLRFEHTRSPYVIELQLDLVPRLLEEISRRASEGVEVGGLLIGSFPRAAVLTLRIQDFVLIERRTDDDAYYNLNPEQRARLSTTRHNLIQEQRSVLGFFRSHLRREKLALSADDRDLLATEFRRAIHTVLIIKAKSPYDAAFFVTDTEGALQAGPPLPDFQFSGGELIQTVPVATVKSVPMSSIAVADSSAISQAMVEQKAVLPAVHEIINVLDRKMVLLGSALACCVILASLALTAGASLTERLFPSQKALRLTVVDQENMLEVHWNHQQPDLRQATSALLIIRDGKEERRLMLTVPELRFGSVAYQRRTNQVEFRLSVELPDSVELAQSVVWSPK